MNKFTYIYENQFNNNKLTFESTSDSRDQILTEFADFLRGCGFIVDGYLDVVLHDDYEPAEELNIEEGLDYDHPEANFDWPDVRSE